MTETFTVTFDYRSPFAYVLTDMVFKGLDGGADWDVRFAAYSLAQAHVEDGFPPVWKRREPSEAPGVLALQVALAVRDTYPTATFRAVHTGLYRARLAEKRDISDPAVVGDVVKGADLDPGEVLNPENLRAGLDTLRREHEEMAAADVFGVPTLLVDDRVAFIRETTHSATPEAARDEVAFLLRLARHQTLTEFKRPAQRRPLYQGPP